MRRRERAEVIKAAGHLRRRERQLLERLAQYAYQDGTLRFGASTAQLALELGVSERTVERARRVLVDRGLIELVSGGTGRDRYAYRVLLQPALAADLADTVRYPHAVGQTAPPVTAQGRQFSAPYKGSRARSDSPRAERHPSPTPSARESCGKHAQRPKNGCRACGTSSRQQGTNPRATKTNPRAGYVTPTPPRHVRTPTGIEPPPGLLDDVRAQLATLRNRRTA